MANLLEYLSKSSLLNSAMNDVVLDVYRAFEAGDLKDEIELRYQLEVALEDALLRLNQPHFKAIPAGLTPVAEDYNQMISTAIKDLAYLEGDCLTLTESLTQAFNEAELKRWHFESEIRLLQEEVSNLKQTLNETLNENQTSMSESFTSNEGTLRDKEAAYVDTTHHLLYLRPMDEETFEGDVSILEGSIGFPGNTHLAYQETSGEIIFEGETNPHFDLTELVDGSTDTWFEYEGFEVDDEVMSACNYQGFHYKEDQSWVLEDGRLVLKLELTFPSYPTANWLSLIPFISTTKGVQAGLITSCVITDGGANVQKLKEIKKLNQNVVYRFNAQSVYQVFLTIEQPYGQLVHVGHRYYIQEDERIAGNEPSVTLLGFDYDPVGRTLLQPSTSRNLTSSIEEVKQALFKNPASQEDIEAGLELIPATRYSVGIKNIELSCKTFEPSSVYVSKTYETKRPIQSIELESTELLGDGFTSVKDYIQYEITIDGGVTWYPIVPRHRSYEGCSLYTINDGDILRYFNQSLSDNSAIINTFESITQVGLKITLRRPEDNAYLTPVISSYRLKLQTERSGIHD